MQLGAAAIGAPWSIPLMRTASGRKWGPGQGRDVAMNPSYAGPCQPSRRLGPLSCWERPKPRCRCRPRVGMPQPLRVAPHPLKKTHLASTALKGESHGWTASCRDNEKARTKYFLQRRHPATGIWRSLKYDENKKPTACNAELRSILGRYGHFEAQPIK